MILEEVLESGEVVELKPVRVREPYDFYNDPVDERSYSPFRSFDQWIEDESLYEYYRPYTSCGSSSRDDSSSRKSDDTDNDVNSLIFQELDDESGIIESWVDVTALGTSASQGGGTPASITQQLTVEDYLRLLREAQESNQSSARHSLAGSRRDSPRSSPKSPPNSPVVQGTPLSLEWQSYYVNSEKEDSDFLSNTDWSSRPDQQPPKNWGFRVTQKRDLSIRYARVGDTSIFSKKGLCTLFLTNLISLIIGTGIGLWVSRHGFHTIPAIKVR